MLHILIYVILLLPIMPFEKSCLLPSLKRPTETYLCSPLVDDLLKIGLGDFGLDAGQIFIDLILYIFSR
ncbi:hypothetical protein Bpfe_021570, partial [Biomphalaria pfeifferi]